MKTYLIAGFLSFIFTIISGVLLIPVLKRLKAGQTILKYVQTHKDKNGTPTMGGLFFVVPAVIVFLFFGWGNTMAVICVTIGLAFMAVGFIDDYIKVKYRKNEGLKAWQKMAFQTSIAIVSGIFAFRNGICVFYIPFTKNSVDLGAFTIIVVTVIFIAMTNSVNLTDGLDGLAGSVSVLYLLFTSILIWLQINTFKFMYLKPDEYTSLITLSSCLIGGLIGFLIFNVSKAKVFMGDTGSLSLGGFLAAISIFSSNSFFIPVLGITFVASSISVILQVYHYKRTKKRIFLMAPLHHHFQLKGLSESKISYLYCVVTAIVGVLCLIFYL